MAYSSSLYVKEIGTTLEVTSLSIWTTAADPWVSTTPSCGLYEFGRYWNQHHTNVSRTLVHMMSGKSGKSGIAWQGALCIGPFSFTLNVPMAPTCPGLPSTLQPYGGDYGFTGGLDGTFDLQNPAIVWDLEAVTHEIGHNFNSPHAHCYQGIAGESRAIDNCFGIDVSQEPGSYTCFSGTGVLPGPNSLSGGVPGQGDGTVMSYCHLLGGGLGNISFTFGKNHPYGISPARESNRMSAYVAARSAACVAPDRTAMLTTIAPCRLVDTRPNSQRFAVNQTRTFNVFGDLSNQGGSATGCALPAFLNGVAQIRGLALNLVAVNPGGAGNLRAWATDQAMPDTSSLNFQVLSPNLNVANELATGVRQDIAGNDFSVFSTQATDLVVDVVGYYAATTPTTGGLAAGEIAPGSPITSKVVLGRGSECPAGELRAFGPGSGRGQSGTACRAPTCQAESVSTLSPNHACMATGFTARARGPADSAGARTFRLLLNGERSTLACSTRHTDENCSASGGMVEIPPGSELAVEVEQESGAGPLCGADFSFACE